VRDHRARDRALHGSGERIQADGLEGFAENRTRAPARFSWRGLAAVLALLAVTAFAAHSCQQSQIRFSKEQAIEKARPEAGFDPERTQIRLVRQGITGHPFWAVSFSVTAPGTSDDYTELTTVRVDANTGSIDAVNRER
jgi:hypothetical protein